MPLKYASREGAEVSSIYFVGWSSNKFHDAINMGEVSVINCDVGGVLITMPSNVLYLGLKADRSNIKQLIDGLKEIILSLFLINYI